MSIGTPPAPIEAVIRSPLGEVRVWIDQPAEGEDQPAVQTSIRIDYGDRLAADAVHHDLGRVAEQMAETIRRLRPAGVADPKASPIGRWLAQRVDTGPSWRTAASDLYRDFIHFCDADGVAHCSQSSFGREMAARGFGRAGKSANGFAYRGGLRLKPGPAFVIDNDAAASTASVAAR